MRTLRIVVRTASGTLPLVVAASVSCGESDRVGPSGLGGGAGMTAGGGVAGRGAGSGGIAPGGSGGGGGVIVVTGGAGGTLQVTGGTAGDGAGGELSGCEPRCPEMTIALPPEGTPAEAGQICQATLEPVRSNRAASFRFTQSGTDFTRIDGLLAIAPELRSRVVGTPVIEVLDATTAALGALEVGPIESGPDGFAFSGSWPASVLPDYADLNADVVRVTLRASLEITCDDGTRLVHAVSDVHLCSVDGSADWATSGDSCCVCRVIAEMAPSPIVPERREDALPLAQALRLRIVELARVSNTVVLFAENDGGEGLDYEWLPSVGTVERLAPDVIAWTLTDGDADPFIQAAVSGPHAAAVASFAFNDRAA
jgi:hypothetical protein